MGDKLAKANPDVESPSQPGNKSIITDPLDKYCSQQRLWDELCTFMRDPLLPNERPVLKTVEITENDGPGDVTVRAILDGQKLKLLKLSEKGDDVCHIHQRMIFCRENWEIWTTDMDPSDGTTPVAWSTTKLLTDPLRIECWGMTPEGKRKSGEGMAKRVQDTYLTPLLLSIVSSKIPVHCQIELPGEGGRCVMSESLEESFDYDRLWRELVITLKQMNMNMGKLLTHLGGKHASALEIEEISDRQFVMQQLLPQMGPSGKVEDTDETQTVLRLQNFTFDESTGEFRVETSLNGQHEETGIYRLLREPLRIAYWKEQRGTRHCGREAGQILQLVLKMMVDGNLAPGDAEQSFFW